MRPVPRVDSDSASLAELLREIKERLPTTAHYLNFLYCDRYFPASQSVQEAQHELKREADARVSWIEEQNRAIDDAVDLLRQQQAEAALSWEEVRNQLLQSRLDAKHRAGELVARAGGLFRPDDLDEAAILLLRPRSRHSLALEAGRPDPVTSSSDLLPNWVNWAMTALIGQIVGISIGLVAEFLHPATLVRQGGLVLGLGAAGFAIATYGRKWISHLFRLAIEREYLPSSLNERQSAWILAGLGAGLLLLTDCIVEREGLLRLVRLHDLVAGLNGPNATPGIQSPGPSSWLYLVAALLVTLGYVGYSAVEGVFKGRASILDTELQGAQAIDLDQRETARRNDPKVQAALSALSSVLTLKQELDNVEQQLTATKELYDRQIAQWEGKRLELPTNGPEETEARIQCAHDRWLSEQRAFYGVLEQVIEQIEPIHCHPSWLQRFWQRLTTKPAASDHPASTSDGPDRTEPVAATSTDGISPFPPHSDANEGIGIP